MLLRCWVRKLKYAACGGDRDRRDYAVRSAISRKELHALRKSCLEKQHLAME